MYILKTTFGPENWPVDKSSSYINFKLERNRNLRNKDPKKEECVSICGYDGGVWARTYQAASSDTVDVYWF